MSRKKKPALDIHAQFNEDEAALIRAAAEAEKRPLANYLRWHTLQAALGARRVGPKEFKGEH